MAYHGQTDLDMHQMSLRAALRVLTTDRPKVSRNADRTLNILKLHSFEKVQEFVLKPPLRLDLKVPSPPVHKLDVAEARAA